MKKTLKKTLMLLLSFAMVLSLIPSMTMTAWAEKTFACYIDENKNGSFDNNDVKYETVGDALEDVTDSTPTTIRLIDDVTENVVILEERNITLDLNGFVMKNEVATPTAKQQANIITNNGILTIEDSNAANQTHYFKVSSDGLWVLQDEASTVDYTFDGVNGLKKDGAASTDIPAQGKVIEVKGGCITGGKGKLYLFTTSLSSAGGIYSSNTLNLNGGNIVGNSAETYGGGMACVGAFQMNGGAVIGNTSIYGGGLDIVGYQNDGKVSLIAGGIIAYNKGYQGSAILVTIYAKIRISGGKITGNVSMPVQFGGENKYVGCCGVTLKDSYIIGGDAVISGNVTEEGKPCNIVTLFPITIGNGTNGVSSPTGGMKVGIELLDSNLNLVDGAFTSNYVSGAEEHFFCDADAYMIKAEENCLSHVTRITEEPNTDNYFTVGVNTGGLSAKPTYQWYKDTSDALEPEIVDINSPYAYMTVTSIGTPAKVAYAPDSNGWLDIMLLGEAEKIYFKLNTEVENVKVYDDFDETNTLLLMSEDGYYCVPVYCYMDMYYFGLKVKDEWDERTKAYTISDLYVSRDREKLTDETSATLKNPEIDETYFCTLTYADGSTDKTKEVTVKEIKSRCKYGESLAAGKQTLLLGDVEAGKFTLSGDKTKGFTLKDANGKYVYPSGNSVARSNNSYTFKYDGGLYTDVKSTYTKKVLFWKKKVTKTTRYYLDIEDERLVLTEDKVCAEIQVGASEHTYSYLHDNDGKHEAVCTKCGKHEDAEAHDYTYDQENHKCICGKIHPDYCYVSDVDVTPKTVTKKTGILFWKKTVTKYQYTIEPKTQNVVVTKVEYSKDGEEWKAGTVFQTDAATQKFYIKVTDAQGHVTNWIYEDGDVKSKDKN